MPADESGLFGCRPVLRVDSVERSLAYYVGSLGFHLGLAWIEPEQRFLQHGETAAPDFAIIGRGNVQLMLCRQGQGEPGMWVHLDVHTAEQLDALHNEWSRNSAMVVEPPSLRAWGMYEMRVRDLDGHTFRVSAPPSTARR
jgi:uncharacterized glyoxalase superfamily protein PhnB